MDRASMFCIRPLYDAKLWALQEKKTWIPLSMFAHVINFQWQVERLRRLQAKKRY